jgi:hypothetical protein
VLLLRPDRFVAESVLGRCEDARIVSEWALAALAASVLAFYASARGLQLGPGVAVIAFTSVAANLAALMGGILVFRDPIGIGALAIVGRVIPFGLVIAGAAMMAAPLQAGVTPERQLWARTHVHQTRDDLRVQAQYARQQYDLYKAKAYGRWPNSPYVDPR